MTALARGKRRSYMQVLELIELYELYCWVLPDSATLSGLCYTCTVWKLINMVRNELRFLRGFAFHDFCRTLDYYVGSELYQFPKCAVRFFNEAVKLTSSLWMRGQSLLGEWDQIHGMLNVVTVWLYYYWGCPSLVGTWQQRIELNWVCIPMALWSLVSGPARM